MFGMTYVAFIWILQLSMSIDPQRRVLEIIDPQCIKAITMSVQMFRSRPRIGSSKAMLG